MPWVTTADSAPADHRAEPGRIGDVQLFAIWAIGGLLAAAVYAFAPISAEAKDGIVYNGAELGAVVGIVVGVRRYQPATPSAWLLIAAGVGAFLAGDVTWSIYQLLDRDPFPSVADVFYLAGYPLMAAGFVIAIRRRTPTRDVRVFLDTAIAAVCGTLLTAVYVVEPYRASGEGLDALVSAAYPIGDLVLFAVVIRLIIGGSWNVWSLRLLLLGVGLTLVGDLLYAYETLARGIEGSTVSNTLLLLGVISLGVAALHPSMVTLTQRVPVPRADLTVTRLMLYGVVILVPAAVVILQALRDEPLYVPGVLATTVALALLVLARFADVTAGAQRSAQRDALLSDYAGELLGEHGRDRLFAVAESTARHLAGVESLRLRGGTGAKEAMRIPVEVRGEVVAELVADDDTVQLERARDALTTVAAQLALALEREQLLDAEREAAEALAQQNEQLRELDQLKDQFVSSVSHELRTPLTAMVGYLELVLDGEAGELNENQAKFLEIVSRNSMRLNRLVDDILFVARVDAGRLTLEHDAVDLAALVASEVEFNQAAADAKGVELHLDSEDGLPPLWADPTRLAQLLSNLITNAVKFTNPGGSVSAGVHRRGDQAEITIADTGVGIPAEEVDQLFQRFFRASTASTSPGTGLGLSIVKSIAEAHGGTVHVESAEGVGTTFTVDLPIRAVPDAEGNA
jgi:signal transduction histidine kinase